MSQEVITAIVAALSALCGGAMVKLIERVLPSADRRIEDDANVRQELWERMERLEKRELAIQADLDGWKDKYYELLKEHHALKAENHSIREENHKLLSALAALKLQIQRMERKFPADALLGVSGPTDDLPNRGELSD